jgi:predicted DNA-binding transcriptional regulator YafY
MRTHERQDALLGWLRGRQSGTAAEAAEHFCVTQRTILRDIDALRARGEPILSSPGPGGGFQLDTFARLPAARLTVEEVIGLTLAVGTARRVAAGVPYALAADHAVDRLIATLPRERAVELRHLMRHVIVGASAPWQVSASVESVEEGFMGKFERAFTSHRVLSFDYTDRLGQATQRVIEPHGLLLHLPIWYVIAHDRLRDAPRMFRVDRMRSVTLSDELFEPKAPEYFEEYLDPCYSPR